MQRYVLEGTGEPLPPPHVDAEQSVAYWVVQHQEPLVIPNVEDAETQVSGGQRLPAKPGDPVDVCAAVDIAAASSRHPVGRQPGAPRRTTRRTSRFCRLSRIRLRSRLRTRRTTSALQQSLALERDRMRNVEACDELLRALSTVLDIRQVFPQVSQIAATGTPSRSSDVRISQRTGRGRRASHLR